MSGSLPIGNSLNNPGNIRTNKGVVYKGEVSPSANPSFKQFMNAPEGFRAMASLLYHYINTNGLNTISKIINTYAPAADSNNPTGYANFVSAQSGIGLNNTLDKGSFTSMFGDADMMKIIRAMARMEQGTAPSETDLSLGYQMFINDQNL